MKSDGKKIRNPKSEIRNRTCAACGAGAHRGNAKYCLTCGKRLREDYQPLDSYRSSYRLQGRSFQVENPAVKADLFGRNANTVSDTAWACFVYSMVPYLGILFIPFTFIIGSYGIAVSFRRPHLGGRGLSLISIGLSFAILAIQIVFWWLLYIIPEITRGI